MAVDGAEQLLAAKDLQESKCTADCWLNEFWLRYHANRGLCTPDYRKSMLLGFPVCDHPTTVPPRAGLILSSSTSSTCTRSFQGSLPLCDKHRFLSPCELFLQSTRVKSPLHPFGPSPWHEQTGSEDKRRGWVVPNSQSSPAPTTSYNKEKICHPSCQMDWWTSQESGWFP